MKKIKILLIEDDADDIELLQEAFQTNKVNCEVDVITEGDRVIEYLESQTQLPNVIVMDLNLPRLHGKEVLSQLKMVPKFSSIPVLILSTSASKDDIRYAYATGANKFITKPNTMQGFHSTVLDIINLI